MFNYFRRSLRAASRTRPAVHPKFRDRRFVLLLVGETINSIGGWASAVVLWGFAAYRFDASPQAISVLIVCWAAPSAVLGPVMGIYVDRVGARRSLVLGYVAGAATALGMAACGSLGQLDVAAVLYGASRALAGPAAKSLPARVVGADELLAANALLGAARQAGQILGPLVASATLALSGFRAAFVLDALTYVIGATVVAPLPLLPPLARRRQIWRAELREGLAVVLKRRTLQIVLLLGFAVTFSSGAFLVVEALYARDVLHRPPSQFALFEAAAGAGAILAGLVLPRLRVHLGGLRHLSLAGIAYGVAACLFIGTNSVPVAYVGAFTWGVSAAVFSVLSLTALQRLTPTNTLGRVVGLGATLQSAADTIGLPVAGVTLAALGIQLGAIALAGVALLAGFIALVIGSRKPETQREADEGAGAGT